MDGDCFCLQTQFSTIPVYVWTQHNIEQNLTICGPV